MILIYIYAFLPKRLPKIETFFRIGRIYKYPEWILMGEIMKKLMTRNEEIILLTILKLEGNAYGVSIQKQINQNTGEKWSFASIYQPLDNLVRKKYVRRKKGDPTAKRGGKSKFYYEVTREGLKNLKMLKKAHDQVWSGIPEISLENRK
jgi:DNA-binding PadR family transcriptional regulator